jgi:hypothetical protein
MPDRQLLLQARDLRERAEEILARAETFRNVEFQQKLLKIAETYVKLAERLEQHARTDDADTV